MSHLFIDCSTFFKQFITMRPSTERCSIYRQHSVQPVWNGIMDKLSALNGHEGGDANLCLCSKMLSGVRCECPPRAFSGRPLTLTLIGERTGNGSKSWSQWTCGERPCTSNAKGVKTSPPYVTRTVPNSAKELHVVMNHDMRLKAQGWSSRWTDGQTASIIYCLCKSEPQTVALQPKLHFYSRAEA